MSAVYHTPTPPAPAPVGPAERLCRASGIAASLLIFFAGAFAPDPPTHGGTDAVVLAHFRTHYDGTMKSVFTWTLGIMALLLFTAAVLRAAERARRAAGRDPGISPTVTLLSGLSAVGMLLAAQAGAGAAAVVGHHANDVIVARGLDEIGHMLAHLAVVPLGLFTASMATTLGAARLGPRWLAAAGVTVGAMLALSGTWVFVGGDRLHNAGGFGWMLMFVWWLAESALLATADRRPYAPADVVAAAAPLAA